MEPRVYEEQARDAAREGDYFRAAELYREALKAARAGGYPVGLCEGYELSIDDCERAALRVPIRKVVR